MAYNQYANPRQQPQQYYDQGHPQGHQQAGYDNGYGQYDNYGYDQGQYNEWDGYQQGYDDQYQGQDGNYGHGNMNGQRPPQQYQQYNDGYADMNGQARQRPPQNQGYGASQRRGPPPQERHYQDQMYDEQMYPEQQGYDQRERQMQPNRPPVHEGMRQGDRRIRDNVRPQNPEQQQGAKKPPVKERGRLDPPEPTTIAQDNPFPTFPTSKTKPRPKAGSMDEAMALMSLGHEQDDQHVPQSKQTKGRGGPRLPTQARPNQGLPPGRGRDIGPPDSSRGSPQNYDQYGRGQPPPNRGPPQQRQGAMSPERRRGPPQGQPYGEVSPVQNIQRSMTMPEDRQDGMDGRDYVPPRSQWGRGGPPGPPGGYQGQAPPRPSTASGDRRNGPGRFDEPPVPPLHREALHQRPYAVGGQQQQQQFPQERRASLDNFYDDYYGQEQQPQSAHVRSPSKASSLDMPNFDAIPDQGRGHRRGYSIEAHLSPTGVSSPPARQGVPQGYGQPAAQNGGFYQQAQQGRSRPNLNDGPNGGVFEMPGDLPEVPVSHAHPTSKPVGLPTNPRGQGPTARSMTADPQGRRPPPQVQGYVPSQQQYQAYPSGDPGYQPHPPMQRNLSDESAWTDPGPAPRSGSIQRPGTANPIQRPGTAAPAPGRMPSDPMSQRQHGRPSNPDALPQHPVPVRQGLVQQPDQVPQSPTYRPPPVRQYNSEPAVSAGPQVASAPQVRRRSVPHPVTWDELNRLRNTWNVNPNDQANGLLFAKKLVEAANVLADEGGKADARTRNKNREKWILEAHKIVKKLVHAGYGDAMFYLADCYGQGGLGLQVDTKEAFTLYQAAAKQGHGASAYRTAVCCEMGHEEGGGTKRDPLKAVQWYRRAAALGDIPALYKMGMILLKGLLGQQKHLGEAINMLKRAADRADEENPHALHELGLLYEAQTGNERVIRDEAYAFSLFQQAAELGYKFSQFRLGQAYEYGLLGCQIDARSSIAWYTRAAAQEEHQSELALSGWYLTGSQGILEQSDTEAYLWARKAACAEPPLPKALFAMGYFTEVGIGCPKTLEEAKRWYGRAAAYKFPKAQEKLEELKRGGGKTQRGRERLSRSNQKHNEENCTVM